MQLPGLSFLRRKLFSRLVTNLAARSACSRR
jgi:hypothetical protein